MLLYIILFVSAADFLELMAPNLRSTRNSIDRAILFLVLRGFKSNPQNAVA